MTTELLLADRSYLEQCDDVSDSVMSQRNFTPFNELIGTNNNKKTWRQRIYNRYNAIVFIFFLLLALLAIASSLLSYFLYVDAEIKVGKKELEQMAEEINMHLAVTMYDMIRAVETLKALYSIRNGTLNFYTEFKPFMEISEMWNGNSTLVLRGVSGLQWIPIVLDAERNSFVQAIRKTGPDFVNFTILNRDDNNTLSPAPRESKYFPILHAAPLEAFKNVIGFNLLSSPFERQEILLAEQTGNDIATRVFVLIEKVKGFIYFSPVYNTAGSFVGLTAGVFKISRLFRDFYNEQVVLVVFDENLTDSDDEYFIYSTYMEGDIDEFGSKDTLYTGDYLSMISNAPFYQNKTLCVADRHWTIIFVPKSKFLHNLDGWPKYIVIASSIVSAIFIEIIIIGITKWRQYRDKLHRLNYEKMLMLVENERSLRNFLYMIAEQEEDSRYTMDSIPDSIIVLNYEGRILKANASFEKGFQLSAKKIENGINISQYFAHLENGFFRRVIDQVETQIKKPTGLLVPVIITSRPLHKERRYLLVIRNIAEKLTMIEQIEKQQNKMQHMTEQLQFDTQLQDIEFRMRLLKFCQKEHNEETLEFIQDVMAYKSKGVTERLKLQNIIFNTYIAEGSPKQLNITGDLVQEITLRLQKSLGDAILFDKVVEKIKLLMISDILPRFYEELKNCY